jgi:hypothetical protein
MRWHQAKGSTHEHAHRSFQVGDGYIVEPLRQADERRGRRRLGDRPQGGAGDVVADVVQVHHEFPAGEHGLGHGQHQLAARQALAPLLDAPHMGVDGLGQPEDPVQLGDEDHPCCGGEARVVTTNLHRPSSLAYRLHPTGAFRSRIWLVSQPQFSRNERPLSRIERTYARLTHGSSSEQWPELISSS